MSDDSKLDRSPKAPGEEELAWTQKPRSTRDRLTVILVSVIALLCLIAIVVLEVSKLSPESQIGKQVPMISKLLALSSGKPKVEPLIELSGSDAPDSNDQSGDLQEPDDNTPPAKGSKTGGVAYVNRAASANCPDGIQARLLWKSSSIAFLVRQSCADIEAQSIAPEDFREVSADKSVLVAQDKLFERETKPVAGAAAEKSIVFCTGVDAKERHIEVLVKQKTDIPQGPFTAKLMMTTGPDVDSVEAAVSKTEKSQKQILFTTLARKQDSPPQPYLNLALTEANGWLAFLNYSLEFHPKSAASSGVTAWRDDEMNLANCFWP